MLRLAPEDEATVPRDDTIRSIRELSAQHKLPQGEQPMSAYVVGEPVLVHDMFQYVEEDGQRLFYASLGLLGLVIFVLFRSVRWVILSVVLVGVTVVWTKAILVVCGIRLSMVSSMLNSLVTIVGIATVMRMMVYYREQRVTFDPLESFRKTVIELSPAIFWTTVTAAAGFVSLLSSRITPVRSFGTMMTLGTMLVSGERLDAPARGRPVWPPGGRHSHRRRRTQTGRLPRRPHRMGPAPRRVDYQRRWCCSRSGRPSASVVSNWTPISAAICGRTRRLSVRSILSRRGWAEPARGR